MKYFAMILICQSAFAQFQVGDSVAVGPQAIDCTSVRNIASTSGSTIKCEPVGIRGIVTAGSTLDVNGTSTLVFFRVSFTDGVSGWAAFTSEERAGNLPGRIHPLFVVYG